MKKTHGFVWFMSQDVGVCKCDYIFTLLGVLEQVVIFVICCFFLLVGKLAWMSRWKLGSKVSAWVVPPINPIHK